MSSNPLEMKGILSKALMLEEPLITSLLDQEAQLRLCRSEELRNLITHTRQILKEQDQPKAVKTKVLAKLKTDLELVGVLNNSLKSYQSTYRLDGRYEENECTFSLKNNKMDLAIQGAIEFVEEHFESFFYDDKVPDGFEYVTQRDEVAILGKNARSIFGDSKGTFLQTAVLAVNLVVNEKNSLQEACFGMLDESGTWIDSSLMTHITCLPNNLSVNKLAEADSRFKEFTYFYRDGSLRHGFSFVHSGYAFGGHRSETDRFPKGKYGGPEDCSSWISKVLGSTSQVTTADQLYFYRWKLNEASSDRSYNGWIKNAPERNTLDAICEPLVIRDPQKDVRPGLVYCHRHFSLEKDPTLQETIGTGGHTAMVIDFISAGSESRFVTLGYNRDMPAMEGMGIQEFPYETPPELQKKNTGRKLMLFSVNATAAAGAKLRLSDEEAFESRMSRFKVVDKR
jgi:hypothetical protein